MTFAKLSLDIYAIAREVFPDIEMQYIGWWWTPEEHVQFADYMNQHAPKTAAGIALHIPYDKTTVADVRLPDGCARNAFVHIGYGELSKPRDIYGHLGPVCAPHRIRQTVAELKSRSVGSVVAYSEGVFDDVNKALLAGLWSDRYPDAEALLSAYARRYFEADALPAAAWAAFLTRWGLPYDRDPAAERQQFAKLSGRPADWRRRQWELKIELFAEHQAVAPESPWTPQRLAHAEAFWAVRERLQREVYGLGPQRHIFADRFIGLPWYESWLKYTNANTPPAPVTRPEQ